VENRYVASECNNQRYTVPVPGMVVLANGDPRHPTTMASTHSTPPLKTHLRVLVTCSYQVYHAHDTTHVHAHVHAHVQFSRRTPTESNDGQCRRCSSENWSSKLWLQPEESLLSTRNPAIQGSPARWSPRNRQHSRGSPKYKD
jgi:hypothetical protein